jgi:hypothetical protein
MKMEGKGFTIFLADGVALIAQVGSENQAQPARVLASVLRFLKAFDGSQPTQKAAQTANRISPSEWDNGPRSRPLPRRPAPSTSGAWIRHRLIKWSFDPPFVVSFELTW